MKLTFIGATLGVTGSKTLLEISGQHILIDSGLYQEGETSLSLTLEDLPYLTQKLSAVVITHAHLDHTGFLPFLYKGGYRGPIYLTLATSKLARIILEDSVKILAEQKDALYSEEDVHNVVSLFKPCHFNQTFEHKNIAIRFHKASHILGAAFVEISDGQKIITFSGDLGRYDDFLLWPPSKLCKTNYLVLESTYGDRPRPHSDMLEELKILIARAQKEKLILLIPCFALHRSQLLVFLIKKIFATYPELQMPLYLNSPMMENVTNVYKKFWESFRPLKSDTLGSWEHLNFLDHYWDIDAVNKAQAPEIILTSSGMLTGGRIWTHLLDLSTRKDVLLFIPGYQAHGTPGFDLLNGKKIIRSPEGVDIAINAEVVSSTSFSSHADQNDLLKWIETAPEKPEKIFLIHGEKNAKEELAKLIEQRQMTALIPNKGESYSL